MTLPVGRPALEQDTSRACIMAAAAPRLRGDGSTSASAEKEPLIIATPPWTLKGDFYTICYWISGTQAAKLPSAAYSPLEASSLFGDTSSSRPVGGVGMIQVMRFKESPVGPYDELAIIPGKFEWARQAADGREPAGQDYKISRIYVSQKHTCYNGRVSKLTNWPHMVDERLVTRHLLQTTTNAGESR